MVQRLPGLLGLPVQQRSGDAGLHVDHRDVVRQHVMQFPGDAQPFVADPAARLLLPGLLGAFGPLLDGGDMQTRRFRRASASAIAKAQSAATAIGRGCDQ